MNTNDHQDREAARTEETPKPPTQDQKGAGPINDPGSGVRQEDGSDDPENMGRA